MTTTQELHPLQKSQMLQRESLLCLKHSSAILLFEERLLRDDEENYLSHFPTLLQLAKNISFVEERSAPAENRTRGPTMATSDFTTKPLVLLT